MRSRLLLAATLLLGACRSSSSTEPSAPVSIDGAWTGLTQVKTNFTLVVAQHGDSVHGSGYMVAGGTTYFAIPDILGAYAGGPELRLVLLSVNGPIDFASDAVTRDSLPGRLTGAGFTGEPLVLYRAR